MTATVGPYYGDEYTEMFVNSPNTKPYPGDFRGVMQQMYFSMATPPVAPTSGDVLYLTKLGKGSRIFSVKIAVPDQGSVGAFSLGYDASAELTPGTTTPVEAAVTAAFITTQDCHTAAGTYVAGGASATAVPPVGIGYRLAAEVNLIMTITTAWDVGVGPIFGWVEFCND